MAPPKSGHPLRMPPESGGIPGRVHFWEVPYVLMLSPGWVGRRGTAAFSSRCRARSAANLDIFALGCSLAASPTDLSGEGAVWTAGLGGARLTREAAAAEEEARKASCSWRVEGREFFIDNLLVRIHRDD